MLGGPNSGFLDSAWRQSSASMTGPRNYNSYDAEGSTTAMMLRELKVLELPRGLGLKVLQLPRCSGDQTPLILGTPLSWAPTELPLDPPEDVGAEGRALVDILRQPPLHGHVPVAHTVAHPHAEVSAVAVDVADGLIVVLQAGRLLRTGRGWRVRVGDTQVAQPEPLPTAPAPALRWGPWAGGGSSKRKGCRGGFSLGPEHP